MNKYEIVGIVGEGAYGIVYKAKNKENGEFGKCRDSPHPYPFTPGQPTCQNIPNLYHISYSGNKKVQRVNGRGRDREEDDES